MENDMSKPWLLTTALTLSAFAAGANAQEAPKPAAELLCNDISTLEEAHAAALVYYIAGFVDGQQAAGGTAAPAGNAAMAGGITLSAAAVLEVCAAAPEMLVADAIAAQGGSAGTAAAPAMTDEAAPPSATEAPAENGETAPAEGAPSTEGETPPAEGATPPAQ